jgi:hypothetical protein
MEASMKAAEPPPPLIVENGVDAKEVAYLKEVSRRIGLDLPCCETDQEGRIISVDLFADENSPPLGEVLARLASLKHVRQAKLVEFPSPPPIPKPLTDDGLQHLAGWTNLERLEIEFTRRLTGRAFRRLIRQNPLSRLTFLRLRLNQDGAKGDQVLAAVENCTELRTLGLSYTDVSDQGLAHVAKLAKLERLELAQTKISDEGLRYLRPLTRLKWLSVEKISNSDRGLEHLSRLLDLTELYTGGHGITDDGLAFLANLTQLNTLSISNSSITAKGLEHLTKLPQLETLFIEGTSLGDEAIPVLSRMQSLRTLFTRDTNLTERGVRSLEDCLPHCNIVSHWRRVPGEE